MAEKTISLADQAYARIKENILNLTYPPGMTLTEAMLTKELDMSRSPVRTAIHMLQTEGLIVSDYYKSMMVRFKMFSLILAYAWSASDIVFSAIVFLPYKYTFR